MSNNGRTETFEVRYRADDGSWQTQTRTRDLPPVPVQTDSSGSSSNTAASQGINFNSNAGVTPIESVKGSAQGLANKEYVEHEFFTLQGDCTLVPNINTVQVVAGDTVNCLGLGKYLSGAYFVDEVTRNIDNSEGYTHSILVQKNGFGGSLKGGLRDGERPGPVPKEVGGRRHVVVAGDTLQSLALWYYGSTGYALRIANANRMDVVTGELRVGKELIIP